MRASVVLIVSLTGCNALLGIGDRSSPACEGSTCLDAGGSTDSGNMDSGSVGNGNMDSGDVGSDSGGGHPGCDTGSSCVTVYQVTGADSQGLAVQSEPHYNHVLKYVPNGTLLGVVCQTARGDQVDGRTADKGTPFTTWDQLVDGTWVYDYYMTTPRPVQGYSPNLAHCPGE